MPTKTRSSKHLPVTTKAEDAQTSPASKPAGSETSHPSKPSTIKPPHTPLPTPSLSSPSINYTYAIARGEMGVLSYEPYKSLILPFWAFRTVAIAQSSATALWSIFTSYVGRGDFVGADMTRKFIQMGMTRAKRYANHKGGRKYDPKTGQVLEKWSGEGVDGEEGRKRREKEEASEVFKGYWRRCIEDEGYVELKSRWMKEKKAWEKEGKGLVVKEEEVKKEEEGEAKSDDLVRKKEQNSDSDSEGG